MNNMKIEIGRKAKNGREIFNGDIAEYTHPEVGKIRGVVLHNYRLGYYVLDFALPRDNQGVMTTTFLEEIEIIGNIFDI